MNLVWCDGAIQQSDVQPFSLRNRGLTLGDGLFETVLVADGVALWLDAHLKRLLASAHVLGIALLVDQIASGVAALVREGGPGLKVLRLTMTRGDTTRGLSGEAGPPHIFMTLDSFVRDLIGQSVTLATSSIRRSHASISSTHKTLSYVDAVVAARQAHEFGCGDALMLNTSGHVASSTIGNIFMVRDSKLITPSLDQGILPGVIRQRLLDNASAFGCVGEERAIAAEELHDADFVFLTNSLRLVRSVTAIDHVPIAPGKSAVILEYLCHSIATLCGTDPRQL